MTNLEQICPSSRPVISGMIILRDGLELDVLQSRTDPTDGCGPWGWTARLDRIQFLRDIMLAIVGLLGALLFVGVQFVPAVSGF
jgi:hypothetical protein